MQDKDDDRSASASANKGASCCKGGGEPVAMERSSHTGPTVLFSPNKSPGHQLVRVWLRPLAERMHMYPRYSERVMPIGHALVY